MILVVYLIGFGVPALGIPWLPTDPVYLGAIALTLCYTAYVAEVYRAGLDSVHPSQRAAALAVGLTGLQAMRYVLGRRRCGGCCRRCSTTSSPSRRTSRWCRSSARWRRSGGADPPRRAFNYTPLVAAALLYIAVTVPLARIVDRQQSRARRRPGR